MVFSCEFCEISKNTFFHKTPPVAASEKLKADSHPEVFCKKVVLRNFAKFTGKHFFTALGMQLY